MLPVLAIVSLVLSLVLTDRMARRRHRSTWGWLTAALFLEWLAVLALWVTPPRRRQCPACGQWVPVQAIRCSHCQGALSG